MKTNPYDLINEPIKQAMTGKIYFGLTKREFFAAMAMQGLLAGKPWGNEVDLCEMAAQLSTILIEELNKDDK